MASYKLHAKNTSLGTTEKALLPVKSIPENPLALYRELETHLQCPFSLIEAFFKEEKLEATTKTTLTELGLHDGARIDVSLLCVHPGLGIFLLLSLCAVSSMNILLIVTLYSPCCCYTYSCFQNSPY